MISATVNFVIVTSRLEDQKDEEIEEKSEKELNEGKKVGISIADHKILSFMKLVNFISFIIIVVRVLVKAIIYKKI